MDFPVEWRRGRLERGEWQAAIALGRLFTTWELERESDAPLTVPCVAAIGCTLVSRGTTTTAATRRVLRPRPRHLRTLY